MIYTSIKQLFKTYNLNFNNEYINEKKLNYIQNLLINKEFSELQFYDDLFLAYRMQTWKFKTTFAPYFITAKNVNETFNTIYRDIHENKNLLIYSENMRKESLADYFCKFHLRIHADLFCILPEHRKKVIKKRAEINEYSYSDFQQANLRRTYYIYKNFLREILLFEIFNDKDLLKRFLSIYKGECDIYCTQEIKKFLNISLFKDLIIENLSTTFIRKAAYTILRMIYDYDKIKLDNDIINELFNSLKCTDNKLLELSKKYKGKGIDNFKATYLLNDLSQN